MSITPFVRDERPRPHQPHPHPADLNNLPERGALPLLGTEPDSERDRVLAAAFGLPVGESDILNGPGRARWVMRFHERLTARRVGIVIRQDWLAAPPEVRLPDALVDLPRLRARLVGPRNRRFSCLPRAEGTAHAG